MAYGPKSGIESAIKSGEIPKGCLIATKKSSSDAEFMFYDTAGDMKNITPTVVFQSAEQLASYLAENAVASRAETDMAGRVISMLEDGVYQGYIFQSDGEKLPIQREELISSVNLGQFNLNEDKKLSIKALDINKVTGLSEILKALSSGGEENREALEELLEAVENLDRITVVSLNGVPLEVDSADRSVNIPLATALSVGLVKSSERVNEISVLEDGIMSVNSIGVSKLVQEEGETLLMCCGDSSDF